MVSIKIKEIQDKKVALEQRNTDISGELSQYDQKQRDAQVQYHQYKSKLDAISNLSERYDGYGTSIQKVMEHKERNTGIIGVVADIIKVEAKYETAIETALGGNIQNIVTDDEETAKKIGEMFKSKIGVTPRITIVPVGTLPRSEKKTKRVTDYRDN